MSDWISEITDRLGPRAVENAPLAPHTTFGIGGPAQLLTHLESIHELLWLKDLARRHELPLRVLGGGSNVLIPDAGLPGITVLLEGDFTHLRLDHAAAKAHAGAGLPISRLAAKCSDAGLSGLEWAAGLPGTVGGAVVGNAGAWGSSCADNLVSVRLLERSGRVHEFPRAELTFGYRHTSIPASGALVLAAAFALIPSDPQAIRTLCEHLRDRRRTSQPIGERSAGSVFKNPPGDSAGRLLDAAGCKSLRVGDALVSPIHANFILNTASATAHDVLALIDLMRTRVHDRFSIQLQTEIILLK